MLGIITLSFLVQQCNIWGIYFKDYDFICSQPTKAFDDRFIIYIYMSVYIYIYIYIKLLIIYINFNNFMTT